MYTFILLLLFYLCEENLAGNEFRPNTEKHANSANNLSSGMINVILFMAKTEEGVEYGKHTEGVTYLNISEIGKVKPCRTQSSQTFQATSAYGAIAKKSCDCEKLLETSLLSLTDWAKDTLGLITALVALKSANEDAQKFSAGSGSYKYEGGNSGRENWNYPSERRDKLENEGKQPPSSGANRDFYSSDKEYMPRLEKVKEKVFVDGDDHDNVAFVNVYPPEKRLKFNNIDMYSKIRPEDFANVRRVKRKLIVDPEITQTFEIEGNRNEMSDEIADIPLLESPQSIWDSLGLTDAIKQSFFVNLLNPMLDPHQRMLDEEKGIDFGMVGRVRQPTLFQLVRRALRDVKMQCKGLRSKGFLLVVQGGNFSEIADSHSDLIQTVKYAQETTDFNNTLLVLTGNCPGENNNKRNLTENEKHQSYVEGNDLPVYGKGPYSQILSKAEYLPDIPSQIKSAMVSKKFKRSLEYEYVEHGPNGNVDLTFDGSEYNEEEWFGYKKKRNVDSSELSGYGHRRSFARKISPLQLDLYYLILLWNFL